MKVAIISMQRVINYGSFLQAYSLKKSIESLGHSCEFVDIKPGERIVTEVPKKTITTYLNLLSKFDRYFMRRIRHVFFSKKRIRDFQKTYFEWLGLGEETNWDKHYDVVVIGSDEVFNCTQKSNWGLSPNLLGGNINADKIITYAASCGHTTYESIKNYGIEGKVSSFLMNIDKFSVRDENTADFVKKLTNKESIKHLDPVFIYDFKEEIKDVNTSYSYLLIYAYDGRINDPNEIREIKRFAKHCGLKTVSAGLYQSWCDKNISVDPFELLGYVKNAKYIITDTFHGTVFSIKYNKQFATLVRQPNKQKLTDLLNRFKLESQIVFNIYDLSDILNAKINYGKINDFIRIEKERSMKYLKDNIDL